MKMVKSLLMASLAISLASAAHAQVPSFSPPPIQLQTFSAALHFVPAVTASKDILTINGSATKIVRVTKLSCSGTSTAAAAIPVVVSKYTAATTAGTATTATNVAMDSLNGASTAVVKAYTAAPTNGTGGGQVRAGTLQTDVPTGATANVLTYNFSGQIPTQMGAILRGVAQELAVTVGATALSAGTALDCSVEWTEQ